LSALLYYMLVLALAPKDNMESKGKSSREYCGNQQLKPEKTIASSNFVVIYCYSFCTT
jgi:hypothetical protein